MLVSLLIIFVICWTPRVAQSFSLGIMQWAGLDPASFALNEKRMSDLTTAFRMFSYLNSVVNALIYHLTSK